MQKSRHLRRRSHSSELLFLYREPYIHHIERAKPSQKLPVVFTRREVQAVLARLGGTQVLIACLLYGGGLRLMEAVRLRVKDIDFERAELIFRAGKGAKDRVTMLPESIIEVLQTHLKKVRVLHQADVKIGFGSVELPYALARKYPNAAREGLAVCVSLNETLARSAFRCEETPPRLPRPHSKNGEECNSPRTSL